MAKHSEYFELALAGFAAVLALLFQPISEHVFANALQAWLTTHMQASEAELIARLSEVIVPAAGDLADRGAAALSRAGDRAGIPQRG
jgi:hypothetical protein